jgi:ubiquinone biosynthesis protein
VCEPIFEKPLKDISFGYLLVQLFKTAGRFNMEVQPSLVLLQKTLLNVEGLGRQLYPELDLWTTALPFLEDWNRRRMQPGTLFKALKENVPDWIEQLPLLPQLMIDNLTQSRELKEINLTLQARLQEESERRKSSAASRFRAGMLLLAGSAITLLPALQPTISTLPGATILLACGGVYLLCFNR